MDNNLCHVLVTYDIANDRKRVKYATLLNGYGFRVQKSCFECKLTNKLYKKLLAETRKYFEKDEDSIRVYLLNDRCKITKLGIDVEIPGDDSEFL